MANRKLISLLLIAAAGWFHVSKAAGPLSIEDQTGFVFYKGGAEVVGFSDRTGRFNIREGSAEVNDERIGCLLVGSGMGDIPQVLTLSLTSRAPKVIDADAIAQLGEPERLRGQNAIITPHEGEFRKLFGQIEGAKPERALEAARRSGAVIVYKGDDTLVASPDGRLGFRPPAPSWLASAGTGDVLAGMVAALRARGMEAFEAASAAVWLHGRAAELAGPHLIADDLAAAIPRALDLVA